jgi:deoxyadenosine/deoxycytidine kinase
MKDMNDEDHLKYQRRWLEELELRIDALNAGRAVPHHRPVLIAIIKDELEFIRKNIFERNRYWENVEKLKSLEATFASLEESEKSKRSQDQSQFPKEKPSIES